MQVLFEIFFIFTAIILLANKSIGFPIKIPQEKQKMANLRKFCTLPIWYGKKHVYHSKICTFLRNVDFDSIITTEYPTTTSTNSEKYQESRPLVDTFRTYLYADTDTFSQNVSVPIQIQYQKMYLCADTDTFSDTF